MGLIDRVDIDIGQTTNLDVKISEFLALSYEVITEPEGETLPYLRNKYLPPQGFNPAEWDWQNKLTEFLKEDNGFFSVEVADMYTGHEIDEGTHRAWFYVHEMHPMSNGALGDIILKDVRIARVANEDFGEQKVNRTKGKPQALAFRFLPTLLRSIRMIMFNYGYDIFIDGNPNQPIASADTFELVREYIVYFKNLENREASGETTEPTQTHTPGWVNVFPWKYQDDCNNSLDALVTNIVKSRKKHFDIETLAKCPNNFEPFIYEIFLSAIATKLDTGDFIECAENLSDLNRKARLRAKLDVAIRRELFENITLEVKQKFDQVARSISFSTLEKYTELILMLEQGAKSSDIPLKDLLEMLGGRSYGIGKQSYGPMLDAYNEFPKSIPEPYRTNVIAHILDQVYSNRISSRGRFRRELLRHFSHAWVQEPYSKDEFLEYMSNRDIEHIMAYLSLSNIFQVDYADQIAEVVLSRVGQIDGIKFRERLDLIYHITHATLNQMVYKENDDSASVGPYIEDILTHPGQPGIEIEDIEIQELTPSQDQLKEVFLENLPITLDHLICGVEKSDHEKQIQILHRTTGQASSYTPKIEPIVPSPAFGREYGVKLKQGVVNFIKKPMTTQIDYLFTERINEVQRFESNLDRSSIIYRENLYPGETINLLPEHTYIISPNGSQMGVAIDINDSLTNDIRSAALNRHHLNGKSPELEVLATFSSDIIVEGSLLTPAIVNHQHYAVGRMWLMNLGKVEVTGGKAKICVANSLDPMLRNGENPMFQLSSIVAFNTFYRWLHQVGYRDLQIK